MTNSAYQMKKNLMKKIWLLFYSRALLRYACQQPMQARKKHVSIISKR